MTDTQLSQDENSLSERVLAATVATINRFGSEAGLQELTWRVRAEPTIVLEGTHPGGQSHPDAEALCEKWAERLQLSEVNGFGGDGCRVWTVDLFAWEIDVFCVTDPERYAMTYPDDED